MRRGSAVLALALLPVALAAPTSAAEPAKAAWYSAAAAGPLVLPAPGTDDGELRVAGTGERPTAYATLALPGEAGGTLVVEVVEGTALGSVELAACPTGTSAWQAGGNQSFEAGPGYDCALGTAFGTPAADGQSVEFVLDSAFVRGGALDVALVPSPEAQAPASVELTAPAFAADAAPAAAEPGPQAEDAAEPAPAADGAPADPLAGGDVPPGPVLDAPALDASAFDATTLDAPALDAPAPALAGPLPPAEAAPPTPELPLTLVPAPAAAVPAAATSPVSTDGPRLLALLALIGVSAGAGYAAGQQRTQPRLIGGRARALPPAGGALAVPAADPSPAALPRGIGRFSRVRDTAPRRLR